MRARSFEVVFGSRELVLPIRAPAECVMKVVPIACADLLTRTFSMSARLLRTQSLRWVIPDLPVNSRQDPLPNMNQ